MRDVVDRRTNIENVRAKRWVGKTEQEKKDAAAAAAKARWDKMSPEEISADMKRRRAKGLKVRNPSGMKKRETRKTKRVLVTLAEADYEMVVAMAAREELSFAALVRTLLRQYMADRTIDISQ